MTDFPAAHSMDTTWFAIDADGYVGIFDSSEGGALPDDLTTFHSDSIQFQSELLEILAADNGKLIDRDSIDLEFILQHTSLKNLKEEIRELDKLNKWHSNLNTFSLYRLFLVASTADIISELQKQSSFVIELYRDDIQTLLYTDTCELVWLKNAIESGSIVGGGRGILLEFNLNLLGWHVYKCDSSVPVPYYRQRLPKKPIHLEDLSDTIIHHMRVTELPNLRFSETEAIQPIEHMPCHTWRTEDWQGTDGEWHVGFPEYPARTLTDLI